MAVLRSRLNPVQAWGVAGIVAAVAILGVWVGPDLLSPPVRSNLPASDAKALSDNAAKTTATDVDTTQSKADDNAAFKPAGSQPTSKKLERLATASDGDQSSNVVLQTRDKTSKVGADGIPADSGDAITDQPSMEKAAGADPEEVTIAATDPWFVQIASQPSAESAKSTYDDLVALYAPVIGGRGVNIVKGEIAGKGTYWRVRVPATSRGDAISICADYKAAGGNCFVSR